MPRPKSQPKVCELCDYRTTVKASYEAHLLTKRHLARVENQGNEQVVYRQCDICQRKYTSYAGLWRHRQTCVGSARRGGGATGTRTEGGGAAGGEVGTGAAGTGAAVGSVLNLVRTVGSGATTETGENTVVFETGAGDTSFQAEVIRHLNELRGLISDLRETRQQGGVVITVTPK